MAFSKTDYKKMVSCVVCGLKYPAVSKCGCPSCHQQMKKG